MAGGGHRKEVSHDAVAAKNQMIIKDCKLNKKYFSQKSPIPYHIAFVFLMIVVIVCLMLGPRLYPIGFSVLTVGAIMEVVVMQKNVSDKYFETCIPLEEEAFQKHFDEVYRPIDTRMLHANAVASPNKSERHGEPTFGREYRFLPSDFEALNLEPEYCKGGDGIARSSVLCFAGMLIDPRRVCVMTKRISMISDDEKIDSATFLYSSLSAVHLEVTPLNLGIATAHCKELVFYDLDNKVVFRLPVHGGVDHEEQEAKLNDLICKAQAGEAAERELARLR